MPRANSSVIGEMSQRREGILLQDVLHVPIRACRSPSWKLGTDSWGGKGLTADSPGSRRSAVHNVHLSSFRFGHTRADTGFGVDNGSFAADAVWDHETPPCRVLRTGFLSWHSLSRLEGQPHFPPTGFVSLTHPPKTSAIVRPYPSRVSGSIM